MFNDQLIPNNGARPARQVAQWSILCGLIRRHANGHLDLLCLKNVSQDFVFMLCLVFVITVLLLIYAIFV